jgi:hypothetical protein
MAPKLLKTVKQKEREERNLAIYNEYNKMMSVEGQSSTLVIQELMRKHKIYSAGTIYVIRKKVAASLNKKEATR